MDDEFEIARRLEIIDEKDSRYRNRVSVQTGRKENASRLIVRAHPSQKTKARRMGHPQVQLGGATTGIGRKEERKKERQEKER
jgi:hypothetical protein